MKKYGLTGYQIKKANEKLEFNKDWMNSNGVHVDNKNVLFSEFVQNSYMNSDRYVAELQHRAWSIFDYAKDRGLENIFLTLTLPSNWHKQKTYKGKLVKNRKFSGRKYICTINKVKFLNCHVKQNIPFIEPILDFSQTVDKYTPRNASKELSKLLKKFFDDRSYKNIQKDDRCYFRVTEPHKDGTPHIHMSLFVPADKKEKVVKALNRLFPAPQSKIEIDVDSPVAYLMKYVLKTLDDLRDDKEITNLTLWYLYHGISRFYTSRTFISLDVYRRLNGMYTLENLTQKYALNEISVYVYSDTKKIALIENEYGTIYIPKPVNWSEKQDFEDRLSEDNATVQIDSGFESIYKDVPLRKIDIQIDDEDYFIYSNQLKDLEEHNDFCNITGEKQKTVFDIMRLIKKQPYQMTNFELYNYFHSLDIDTVDDKHYLYTKNLMIDKGLLTGEYVKLDSIEDLELEFDSEVF